MSQLVVFISKRPIGRTSKKVWIAGFDSVKDFHDDVIKSMQEDYPDFKFMDLDTFTKKLENLPVRIKLAKAPHMTIESILKFDNVPEGRNVTEIVSAMYYACSRYHLVKGNEIKRGKSITSILRDPDEILDPKTFDWNIPKLIKDFGGVLWLCAFMDMKQNGDLYPDSMYVIGEEDKEDKEDNQEDKEEKEDKEDNQEDKADKEDKEEEKENKEDKEDKESPEN